MSLIIIGLFTALMAYAYFSDHEYDPHCGTKFGFSFLAFVLVFGLGLYVDSFKVLGLSLVPAAISVYWFVKGILNGFKPYLAFFATQPDSKFKQMIDFAEKYAEDASCQSKKAKKVNK